MSVLAWRDGRAPVRNANVKGAERSARLPRCLPCSPGLLAPADTEPPPLGHSLSWGVRGQSTAVKHWNTERGWEQCESYTITKQRVEAGLESRCAALPFPARTAKQPRGARTATRGMGRLDSIISEVFSSLVDSVIPGRKPEGTACSKRRPSSRCGRATRGRAPLQSGRVPHPALLPAGARANPARAALTWG